jgi:exopolysaccharide biosynthesis polyprenyl glycosylphosphotransferase
VHLSVLADVPVLSFETTFLNRWEVFVKRAIDVIVSLVCILVLSPLLIAIAVYIKIVSPGPVFFIQKRCGLSGRVFPMLKFRTMVVGADKMLDEIKHLNEAISGPGFKMDNDPRFIKGAKLLRKYSLDEIPQLFNVFWGHMSLVGPRPPIPYEVDEYDDWQRRRMSVRPGMTCLWQIGGRTNIGFEEQLNLDLRYIDQWSLWLDLKIILKTFPVVVAGTGK